MRRKLLYTIGLTIGLIILLSAPAALSQASAPQANSPVLLQNQAPLPDRPGQGIPDRIAPFPPDQAAPSSMSQAPPTGTLSDTQARVQDALQRQIPGNAIHVSVTDDGSLQLTGTVPTSDQKRRAEDIARSTTNNQSIVNKISVRSEEETALPK